MTQGVPLSMVSYIIGVLPLIERLKAAYPDVAKPYYADNSGGPGMFDNIGLYFNSLKCFALGHEYYPKPPKNVLIVHPDNFADGKKFSFCCRFNVFTGIHYLSIFIGDDDLQM